MTAMRKQPVRVLLADEEPYARMWCAGLILRDPRTTLIGDTSDLEEALNLAARKPVDLALIDPDFSHPLHSPGAFLHALRLALPDRPLLCLSRRSEPNLFTQALNAGANGFLLKRDVGLAVVTVLLRARMNLFLFSPGMEQIVQATLPKIKAEPLLVPRWSPTSDLSCTQIQLLRMRVLYGMRASSVAQEVAYQTGTIEKYMSQIYSILENSIDLETRGLDLELTHRLSPEELALLLFTSLP